MPGDEGARRSSPDEEGVLSMPDSCAALKETHQPQVLVETAGLSEKEWLAYRRKGIGGSDEYAKNAVATLPCGVRIAEVLSTSGSHHSP